MTLEDQKFLSSVQTFVESDIATKEILGNMLLNILRISFEEAEILSKIQHTAECIEVLYDDLKPAHDFLRLRYNALKNEINKNNYKYID